MNQLLPVKVWDLPTRLFHWSLVLLIIFQWATASESVYYNMTWHSYGGYAILCLLAFRLLWGFFGNQYARFWQFTYSPITSLHYLLGLFKSEQKVYLGHNPLGAYSVFALLLLILIQAVTGLFADDDIFTTGPFAHWVSGDTRQGMTSIHYWNFNVLLAFIALHLSAILFYLLVKRDNLVRPMITGKKWVTPETTPHSVSQTPLWLALLLFGIATGLVLFIVLYVPSWR
ncbi:cytochrome b/b6 domain-containing protein [Thioflexithrix psekupsensis]|uniref:Cytochrome b561 bacterial/Ni-hydrogenase domain-containing protein n=1 Tax=Thioflexithrix psekupsensis TaxID=1570016 RepID=A0A251X4E1_9GAMM|nr:cytochrome b/b6 domain-containing protein [Thioflexithrix psekupsensis]OUD12215.1 hypothetical protein TPSD3_13920 [Thioflexithrix psekupsensis]